MQKSFNKRLYFLFFDYAKYNFSLEQTFIHIVNLYVQHLLHAANPIVKIKQKCIAIVCTYESLFDKL